MNETLPDTFYHEVANSLSTLTDGKWSVKIDRFDNRTIVEEGSNLGFFFKIGGYGNEGRIAIRYDRPRDHRGEYVDVYHPMGNCVKLGDPRITVASTKLPAVIAKDIVRRMLDASKNVHELVLERIKSTAEYYSKKANLATEVANLCNATIRNPESDSPSINPYETITPRADFRIGYGEYRVSSESVDIKLTSVPAELAKRLVTLIDAELRRTAARVK